jgi:hypothetical protein
MTAARAAGRFAISRGRPIGRRAEVDGASGQVQAGCDESDERLRAGQCYPLGAKSLLKTRLRHADGQALGQCRGLKPHASVSLSMPLRERLPRNS